MNRSTIATLTLAAGVLAGRMELPDIGLSVHVPEGWVAESEGTLSWSLRDTTLLDEIDGFEPRHSGIIYFDAFSGVSAVGERNWVIEDAYAWRIFMESNPCYGWISRYDSTLVDGRFAMFVQGEWAYCSDSMDFQDEIVISTQYTRVAAQGDVGWELSLVTDSTDFYSHYFEYRALLDSVSIDPLFNSVGISRPRGRVLPGLDVRRVDGAWKLSDPNGAILDALVVDPAGRAVGKIVRTKGGWLWNPDHGKGVRWMVARTPDGIRGATLTTVP